MFKKLLVNILVFVPAILQAQVTLNVQMPSAGLVQKDQLWNLMLVNNSPTIYTASLQLNLQDPQNGQIVLTATTGNFLLGKGVKMMRVTDIQPINYTYSLPDFNRNYLPMGNYVACYQVIDVGTRSELALAEECLKINIDPLSPPLLNTPSNKAELDISYPQFTWMPPAPLDMFSTLSYDLLVTEVLPGQTDAEAIQNNFPIYNVTNLTQTFNNYASSFKKLDTGKIYAWQVVAKNGINYAAKTEVWSFKLKSPSAASPNRIAKMFIEIQSITDENNLPQHFISERVLRLKYYSSQQSQKFKLSIFDENKKIVSATDLSLAVGENFIELPLTLKIKVNKTYKVELQGAENSQPLFKFNLIEKKII
jgi:hypothetical protein